MQERRLLLIVITITSTTRTLADVDQKYNEFKNKYQLTFGREDEYRYSVFQKNVEFIEKTNNKTYFEYPSDLSYKLEVNKFTVMTDEEFDASQWPLLSSCGEDDYLWKMWHNSSHTRTDNADNLQAPTDFSWTDKGAVNPPIDQGSFGGCYAIATLGNGSVEGAFKIKTGYLPRMAPQEIIDCSPIKRNRYHAMEYVMNNGIVSDSDYPYLEAEGSCWENIANDKTKQCLQVNDLKGIAFVEDGHLKDLVTELQKGPIAVGINASPPQWKQYKGGILDGFDCTQTPKHSILLVGYGVENGKGYWKLRNSWGTNWGEEGYVRIARDPKAKKGPGFCNILFTPAIRPVLAKKLKATACRGGKSKAFCMNLSTLRLRPATVGVCEFILQRFDVT